MDNQTDYFSIFFAAHLICPSAFCWGKSGQGTGKNILILRVHRVNGQIQQFGPTESTLNCLKIKDCQLTPSRRGALIIGGRISRLIPVGIKNERSIPAPFQKEVFVFARRRLAIHGQITGQNNGLIEASPHSLHHSPYQLGNLTKN
jgi:hypothetical protein